MIDSSEKRFLKYILFFNLYASEGLILALSTVITVLYFNELNIPISTTTFVAGLINTPWILKFLPGPLFDYFRKIGRKPFIIAGGLLGAFSLFPLAILNPVYDVIPFTILFFTSHLGIVFLDVSADAWAIETSVYSERGKINASMTSGLFFSLAMSGIFFAFIGQSFGYNTVFIIAGFIVLLLLILPFFVKEKEKIRKQKKVRSILIKEFSKKNTILFTLLEFISALNFGILIFIIPDFIKNVLYFDDTQTGILSAIYPISIVLGTIIGGIVSDRYGRKKIMYYSFTGSIIFSASFIFVDTWQLFALIYAFVGLFQGTGVYSALAAMAMDITNPKIGATQYSILASIHNVGDFGIAIFSGMLVTMLGYTRFFLYAAWIIGPAILILYFIEETKQ